jgi:hypothetical protein
MATASLSNPQSVEGGTAYEVSADPFDAEPFDGPAGRDWARFVVNGPDCAEFHWRTRADRVHTAVRALEDGRASIDDVLEDEVVAEYVSGILERFDPEEGDDVPQDDEEARAEWVLRGLRWEDLVESDGPRSTYDFEDDAYLHEAAGALELPEWASRESMSAGGPGTGYDAALVVVDEDHSLEDLAAWLRARAAERVQPPAKVEAPLRGAAARRALTDLFAAEVRAPLALEIPAGPLYYRPYLACSLRHPGRLPLVQSDMRRMNDYGDGFFMAGFWGHGAASYAFYWCEVNDRERLFLRLHYGSAYADRDEERHRLVASLGEYAALRRAARESGWRFSVHDWMSSVQIRIRCANGRGLVYRGEEAPIARVIEHATDIGRRPAREHPRVGHRFNWLELGQRSFSITQVEGEGANWTRLKTDSPYVGGWVDRDCWEKELRDALIALPSRSRHLRPKVKA